MLPLNYEVRKGKRSNKSTKLQEKASTTLWKWVMLRYLPKMKKELKTLILWTTVDNFTFQPETVSKCCALLE